MVSERLRKAISKTLSNLTLTTQISASLVADFIGAVEDPNSEFTKEVKYGEIVPPCVLWMQGITYKGPPIAKSLEKDLPPGHADAGGEWEALKPVRIGDVITARTKLGDILTRESRSRGTMLMLVLLTTYTNQEGEIVSTYKHNILFWES